MMKKLKNNFALKLLAIVFAAGLWLLVVNFDNPIESKSFRNIVVEVRNEEVVKNQGMTYQILSGNVVTVTVRAKRGVLEKIKATDIVAYADMNEIDLRNTMIPIAAEVIGYDEESALARPGNMQVEINVIEKNTYAISAVTTGTVRDGYAIGELLVDPEKVDISAPEPVLRSIAKVVAQVDVNGLYQDSVLQAQLILYDENAQVIGQTQVTNNLGDKGLLVKVQVLNTKRVPVIFETQNIIPASGYVFAGISHEPTTINIAAKQDVLDMATGIFVPKEALSLSELTQNETEVIDISEYLPEGTKLVDEEAGKIAVTVTIEEEGTKTISIPVNKIVINNLEEDLLVEYGSQQEIVLKFSGVSELLETLTENNLAVSLEMKNYTEEGKYTIEVQIASLQEGIYLVERATVEVELKRKQ